MEQKPNEGVNFRKKFNTATKDEQSQGGLCEFGRSFFDKESQMVTEKNEQPRGGGTYLFFRWVSVSDDPKL